MMMKFLAYAALALIVVLALFAIETYVLSLMM